MQEKHERDNANDASSIKKGAKLDKKMIFYFIALITILLLCAFSQVANPPTVTESRYEPIQFANDEDLLNAVQQSAAE